jgi:hypothetical protein
LRSIALSSNDAVNELLAPRDLPFTTFLYRCEVSLRHGGTTRKPAFSRRKDTGKK